MDEAIIVMQEPLVAPLNLGLIGWPLEHSYSPRIHTAALDALDMDGAYMLYPVPPVPQGQEALEGQLLQMRRRELHGLNVTIPHKQAVIPLLDELTPTARAIGAVNTIIHRGNKLLGDNTDAAAFVADLDQVGAIPTTIEDKHALVLGAGGAARAVVYALIELGVQVTIAARRPEQAQSLLEQFRNSTLETIPFPGTVCQFEHEFILIVNTTPVGMFPDTEANPWPADLPFPVDAFIYDLVYNPKETSLVIAARRAGLLAVTGMGMLVEQAAQAWEQWTGLPAPRQQMRCAVGIDLEAK